MNNPYPGSIPNICIVCGSSSSSPLYTGLLRCGECGHVFAGCFLSKAEVASLYQRGYFEGNEYIDYLADKQVIQKNFALRLKALKPFLNETYHKRLLEIGCAYGFFLEVAEAYFESVSGIDITEAGVAHAVKELGLDAIAIDFLDYDLQDRQFDVVCLWDTIEHLKEPHRYLEKIALHTTPGAILALTTGDISSLMARWRKQNWRLIHPPTHLHYFSPRTLGRLLSKFGFTICYHRHCGFYRRFDTIAYTLFVLRHSYPRLYRRFQKTGLARLHCYLNAYDISYIIARKGEIQQNS